MAEARQVKVKRCEDNWIWLQLKENAKTLADPVTRLDILRLCS